MMQYFGKKKRIAVIAKVYSRNYIGEIFNVADRKKGPEYNF
jgi:hypothetical protein